jgi:hypothetical protein
MGAFRENFGAQEGLPRAGLYAGRIAAQIDLFADLYGLNLESRAGRFQDLERGVHDFRADTVAVGYGDRGFGGHSGTLRIVGIIHIRNGIGGFFNSAAPVCQEAR